MKKKLFLIIYFVCRGYFALNLLFLTPFLPESLSIYFILLLKLSLSRVKKFHLKSYSPNWVFHWLHVNICIVYKQTINASGDGFDGVFCHLIFPVHEFGVELAGQWTEMDRGKKKSTTSIMNSSWHTKKMYSKETIYDLIKLAKILGFLAAWPHI